MTVSLAPSPEFIWFTPQGTPAVGYQLFTYIAGTSTPQATYTDSTQTTTNTNPVILNSAGYASVWLNSAQTYKLVLQDASGNLVWSQDQIPGGFNTGGIIGGNLVPSISNTYNIGSPTLTWANGYFGTQVYVNGTPVASFPITAAETATGFTTGTLFMQYPYGNVLRYGVVANSSGAAAANSTFLKTLFNPSVAGGPSGTFYFPNTSGSDVYTFSGVMPCRAGIHIDAMGSTINYVNASPTSADADSGLFMAQNDFSFVNGTINVTFTAGAGVSSAGNAFWFGFRGSDSARWPLNPVYDSLLTIPQGGFKLEDVRINSTITGTNVPSAGAISITGGVQGLDFRNVYITGSGTGGMQIGIVYEFGWANSGTFGDTGQSSRSTSHLHGANFENISITNLDNVAGGTNGIIITGGYACFFKNIYISGASTGITCNPGEAQYYRPQTSDNIGARREMQFRNITVVGASVAGIDIVGKVGQSGGPIAGGTYLWFAWVTATAYVNLQTVVNAGNMYVNTGGSGTSSVAPTGTGTTTDGSLIWVYVDLTRFTDLLDLSIDGFAISCTGSGNAIVSYAGTAHIKNGYLTGGSTPLILSEETTRFDVDGVVIQGGSQVGIQADFTASAIWSPPRLKRGVIRNCYIAGNSTSSAGAYGGISIKNFDGVTIENCRLGFETAYSFIQELTQGQALFISSTTAGANANLRIRGCRVAGSVGGIGFQNNSATANQGCIAENCTYNSGGTNPVTTPLSGAWMSDLEGIPATGLAITNNATITSNGLTTCRVLPGGPVTGIILQKGSYQGQKITVINESANLVTFAAVGTSFVADGVSATIVALTQKTFYWDTSTAVWYHS